MKKHFDVVAIIRGGGGDVGLSCFNSYLLAREIALFPIPVITGIGHATNETVVEMVSFSNAITPTKLAEYLLQTFHNFSVPVRDAEKKIVDKAQRLLSEVKMRFQSEIKLFTSVVENVLLVNRNDMKGVGQTLVQQAKYLFKNEGGYLASAKAELRMHSRGRLKEHQISIHAIERNIGNMSPQSVLKRGYSITLLNGKSVRDISEVKNGDSLSTIVDNGSISSVVVSSTPSTDGQ